MQMMLCLTAKGKRHLRITNAKPDCGDAKSVVSGALQEFYTRIQSLRETFIPFVFSVGMGTDWRFFNREL